MDDTVLKIALASFHNKINKNRVQTQNVDSKITGGRNV